MNSNVLYITVASWEDRFKVGLERYLNKKMPNFALIYYYKEYKELSNLNIKYAINLCKKKGIAHQEYVLSFEDNKTSWLTLYSSFNKHILNYNYVVIDITTMPREVIWTLFYFATLKNLKISYIYNRPESYDKDWLSRDAGFPRLLYKLGGISKLGLPTVLLVLTGFDKDRVKQLIRFFDPFKILMGFQPGEQYDNHVLNRDKFTNIYKNRSNVTIFEKDSYSKDHGYLTIKKYLHEYIGKSNIIMSSLGPKTSSIALFKIHLENPEIGLVYTPSKEYNPNYSKGIIDESIPKQFNY